MQGGAFRTEHTAAWAQALNRFVAILIFNYFLGVAGAASVGQSLAPAPPKVHKKDEESDSELTDTASEGFSDGEVKPKRGAGNI